MANMTVEEMHNMKRGILIAIVWYAHLLVGYIHSGRIRNKLILIQYMSLMDYSTQLKLKRNNYE